MKSIFLFCLIALAGLFAQQSQAQVAPHTPAAGSKERSEIADAVRKPIQTHLKKPVIFKIEFFRVLGDWAFLSGTPLQPGGTAMNYTGTPYEEPLKEGMFEDWFCALLQKKDGQWTVIQWQIGATDATYVGWDELYKAPSAIFPATQ